jgi:non-specific serine/threonine protein kinase
VVEGADRHAGAGGGGLTRRETEVAALVGQGLTDRKIAERLVITEGTAGSHVVHILNKLGFRSRTQVAVWASEHGLLPAAGARPAPL